MVDDGRSLKRQKLTPVENISRTTTAPRHPRVDKLGFYLSQLKGTPETHNLNAKSLKNDLLMGEFSRCLLTNYMFDLQWLFTECPRLRQVPVLLVHGERDRQR
ncbi:hypothetical protein KXD40_003645 [Peronospora effusa]|uniref:Uncharacterized protein n=1 Tax=Peronospora effusa TaxID=542832 RepID=A0A3M6VLB5_9STRA|nr:hypothetical protein DD238_003752 [Peronospora effusa]UIZ22855.1 hypothetical protein KXD40_003645 [Peronospora effusa]